MLGGASLMQYLQRMRVWLDVVECVRMSSSSRSSRLESPSLPVIYQPLRCWLWLWQLGYGAIGWGELKSKCTATMKQQCMLSTAGKPETHSCNAVWESCAMLQQRLSVLFEQCISQGSKTDCRICCRGRSVHRPETSSTHSQPTETWERCVYTKGSFSFLMSGSQVLTQGVGWVSTI